MMKVNTGTHIGKRESNQDVILNGSSSTPKVSIHLLADGMGGYDNGQIAAQISTETIFNSLTKSKQFDIEDLQNAVNEANHEILKFQNKSQSRLGATIGGIILAQDTAKFFWVGDVKIMLYSKNKLKFESRSHNLTNELLNSHLSNEALKSSKYSHVVTRSIQGDIKKSLISYQEIDITKDDVVLICSDGLHNIIDSQTIQHILNNNSFETFNSIIHERLKIEAIDNASLISISVNNIA